MLDDHEELRGSVSFLQIAPPSREAVDAYQVLREELDRLAGRINADYADLDWMPIRYLARGYSRDALCGLYRLARVGLVTPLHDGMNLVAKEFVAAQDPDDPGALVLSEFAGAAEQLQAALLVNPHDIAATADAIYRALSMPLEERRERWQDADPARARAGHRLVAPQLPGRARTPAGSRHDPRRPRRPAPRPGRRALPRLRRHPGRDRPRPRRHRPAARHRRRRSPASPAASAAPRDPQRPRPPRPRPPHARRRSGAPAATASRSCRPAPPRRPPPPPLPDGGPRAAPRRRRARPASGSSSRARSPRCTTAPRPRPRPPASPPPTPPPPRRPAWSTSPARWWSRSSPPPPTRAARSAASPPRRPSPAAARSCSATTPPTRTPSPPPRHLGGLGVKVGPGATAARLRAPDPAAVRAWLARESTGPDR